MLPLYLNTILGEFYQSSIKSGISAQFLQSYAYEISRYLNSPPFNRNIDIETHPGFISSCQFLRSYGHVTIPDQEDTMHRPISHEDLRLLYQSPYMSCDTPESLQNKVWVDINLYFGVLSRKTLRQLDKSSFVLEVDSNNGRRYYRIADHRIPQDRHQSRMYEHPGSPLCPVTSMLFYYSKLNPNIDAFFQQPDKSCTGLGWYHPTAVGKNVHSGKLSSICRCCGIKIYYRNTALRSIYRSVHSRSPDYTPDFSDRIFELISSNDGDSVFVPFIIS